MPAEWEAHAGVWFTFPREEGISFPGRFAPIPGVYRRIFEAVSSVSPVNVNVWDAAMGERVRKLVADLPNADRITCHVNPAYEPWCRDHGPIFVRRKASASAELPSRAIVDWRYNAWGGKYPPFDLDDRVPEYVARLRDVPIFQPEMILEGGSIDVNGAGTLLTTTSCLLNPNRNPHLSQKEIEANLCRYLGVSNVLWLGDGIDGDDTDGHVDDLARFVTADTVVTVVEQNPKDANYRPLQENRERLQGMRDQDGHKLQVAELPMPEPMYCEGQRLPASYANFLITNKLVLLPIYNCKADKQAMGILGELLPGYKICGLDSTDLIWGLGSFHCISQQEIAE